MGCGGSKQPKPETKLVIREEKTAARRLKLVLLGSSSVGKTTLASRYCLGDTGGAFGPTVGGVYFKKDVQLKGGVGVALHIWDTAGEEKYRSMASLYYRDADVIALVFDLTDMVSFQQLEYWVGELDYRIEKQEVVVLVVGNKADLPTRIPQSQLDAWLRNYPQFRYFQVSAMTGQGVSQVFQTAAETFIKANCTK